MDELNLKELSKIIGGQSFSEVKKELSAQYPVNFIACSNIAPCNALDWLGCTYLGSCGGNARFCY